MTNVIDYVDVYNGQPTGGLDRAVRQAMFPFAYVSDGAGNPCADGTTLYRELFFSSQWLVSPPCTAAPLGGGDGGGSFTTLFGFAPLYTVTPVIGAVEGFSLNANLTGSVTTGDPGAGFATDCVGGAVIDPSIFSTPPVIHGVPAGSGSILWSWTPGVLLDARLPIVYAISVSTGTPSSHPISPRTVSTNYLSTGLVNGTVYNARVEAYAACGGGSVAASILFNSTRAASSPNGSTGGDGLSNIASATPQADLVGIDASRIRYRITDG